MNIGNDLVSHLRYLCDNVQKRLWIAVPFIGSWKNVERIIGSRWISDQRIDVKLLTDRRNEAYIQADTIKNFQHRAEIKSLDGLHAKLYFIDDKVLLTSANLTGTAFSRRYECGKFLNCNKALETIFLDWWRKARKVDSSWIPKRKQGLSTNDDEEDGYKSLKKLFELPSLPIKIKVFKNYVNYLKAYRHFKIIYEKNVGRIWNTVPVYQEIDSFLNYLFHEHIEIPSRKYIKKAYRKLSDEMRVSEVKKYGKEFKIWLKKSDLESAKDRLRRLQVIRGTLSRDSIGTIKKTDVKTVVSYIHSMNSFPLNKSMFLNSKNNKLSTIINYWSNLLHGHNKSIEHRMEECNKNLFRFGKSAIQELISYYYPDMYPVINRNSNCGLKFFGYEIDVY
jgi:hypothetical protein